MDWRNHTSSSQCGFIAERRCCISSRWVEWPHDGQSTCAAHPAADEENALPKRSLTQFTSDPAAGGKLCCVLQDGGSASSRWCDFCRTKEMTCRLNRQGGIGSWRRRRRGGGEGEGHGHEGKQNPRQLGLVHPVDWYRHAGSAARGGTRLEYGAVEFDPFLAGLGVKVVDVLRHQQLQSSCRAAHTVDTVATEEAACKCSRQG